MNNTLSWEDVGKVATEVFRIWVDHPELKWAKRAWEIIIRAGLAAYSNEDERCEAAIRFLSMCGIYYDFCEVAWEEQTDLDYVNLAEELEIGAIRIGLRLGSNSDDWLNRYEEDKELYCEGVKYLADKIRTEVYSALCKGFGSDDRKGGNEVDLFLSLWKSNWPDPDEDDIEDLYETDFEIMNNVAEGKGAAYGWICSGCEPLH